MFGASAKPPTAAERLIYQVQTNWATVTLNVTNTIVQTNVITIGTNVTQVVVTNASVTPITTQEAEYTMTTSPTTTAVVQGAGAALNTVAPGIGSMVSMGILALLAVWAHLRGISATNTSQSLAQEIEALREFIQTLPSGAKYDVAITSWLQSHQVETGVATQVLGLLANQVSNPDAKAAVTEIQATIAAASKVQ